MSVREQIDAYIRDQAPAKSEGLLDLHRRILAMSPDADLWFLDGRNDEGKIVSNPSIGYGSETLNYADGKSREFYKLGLSANTSGISLYVMGLNDKTYLIADLWIAARQGEDHRILHSVQIRRGRGSRRDRGTRHARLGARISRRTILGWNIRTLCASWGSGARSSRLKQMPAAEQGLGDVTEDLIRAVIFGGDHVSFETAQIRELLVQGRDHARI